MGWAEDEASKAKQFERVATNFLMFPRLFTAPMSSTQKRRYKTFSISDDEHEHKPLDANIFIQAHEADLVHHQPDAARSLSTASAGQPSSGLIRCPWQTVDGEEDVWVDRYGRISRAFTINVVHRIICILGPKILPKSVTSEVFNNSKNY